MKKTIKYIQVLLYILFSLSGPAVVFADVISDLDSNLQSIEESEDAVGLISSIYEFAIPLSIMGLVALTAFSAFKMISSQGDPEALAEAKEIITNAVLGFTMIILSVALLTLLADVLGDGSGVFSPTT